MLYGNKHQEENQQEARKKKADLKKTTGWKSQTFHFKWTEEDMEVAISTVIGGSMSQREAAQKYSDIYTWWSSILHCDVLYDE